MNRCFTVQTVLTVLLCIAANMPLAGAGAALADEQGEAVAKALAAAPPALSMSEARLEALAGIDAFIARPMSHTFPDVIAYYRAAVDRALDKLERERVASGVRIFQLYSSSFIVQTPETVFAFDLDQGPNEAMNQKAAEEGVAFRMTDAQVARVAKLVDYSFHTHEHGDHIDYAITKALIEAGKTVVVTSSNKKEWLEEPWAAQPWAKKLTELNQTVKTPHDLGPLKVDVLWDRQWGDDLHTRGTDCNAYVVTTPGGITVMTKGDINCGLQLLGWLDLIKERGQKIDVVVGSLIFWRGVDTLPQWNALFTPTWLPGHTWEFGHRKKELPKGNCLGYVQSYQATKTVGRTDKVQVLSWGEWIDVPGK